MTPTLAQHLASYGNPWTSSTLRKFHVVLPALKREENHMRPLVEPPPSLHCMCGGELQLKLIEPAARALGKQREIFICTNCSREQTFLAERNPYVPTTACGARHKIWNRKAL